MLVLNSEITIGRFSFRGVHEVAIKENIHEYANTCSIKLPTSAMLDFDNSGKFESIMTARQFNVGDPVLVKLGYDGQLQTEFKGFVKQPNFTTPAEIECEGYSWLLRKNRNITGTWGETDLITILKIVVGNTGIKLHSQIPKIPLLNLKINNCSGTQVLDYLKELMSGTITFCMFDDVLYAGLAYTDVASQTVKLKEGWNVISADDLKYKKAENLNVKIQFKFKGGDGADKNTNEGKDGGIIRRETVSITDSQKWLNEMAQAKLKQETFTGFEGSVNCFLIPYCRMGYRVDYTSPAYKEKNGIYFCDGIETTFGQSGGRRKIELGLKLT